MLSIFVAGGVGILFAQTKSRGATLSELKIVVRLPLRYLAPFDSYYQPQEKHSQKEMLFLWQGV